MAPSRAVPPAALTGRPRGPLTNRQRRDDLAGRQPFRAHDDRVSLILPPDSDPAPKPTTMHSQRSRQPISRWTRILPLFPTACAALTVGVLLHLTAGYASESHDYSGLGVLVFDLLGPLGLAVLIRLGKHYWPNGMLVVLAACLVFTATTFWVLIDLLQSEDANGALLLLFLPIYQLLLSGGFAAVAALTHWLRRRTSQSEAR